MIHDGSLGRIFCGGLFGSQFPWFLKHLRGDTPPGAITHHFPHLLCSITGQEHHLFDTSAGQMAHPILYNPLSQSRNSRQRAVHGKEADLGPVRRTNQDGFHQQAPLPNVFLWWHMAEEPGWQEWDRSWLESQYGLAPTKDIHYTDGHSLGNFRNPADMPALYQLWDCLLYLSGGEGFGMPAWEAMCCAIPVVYTNYSSHGEFLSRANAGLPVGGILQPEKRTCIWRMVADVEQAIEALRKIYFGRALGNALGANGGAFVRQFTAGIQAERWHSMLQKLNSSSISG
jgi:glycosyltransferase involved in cell wall biosynthesis